MKTIKILLVIPFLFILIGMAGCEDENQKCNLRAIKGPIDNIVGKWKQVRVERIPEEYSMTADYSCDNIIYSFQEDGKLVIMSDKIEYIGHSTREYEYEFRKSPHGQIYHSLIIDGRQYPCTINKDNTMIFDLEPDPGPLGVRAYRTVLYFIRIQ